MTKLLIIKLCLVVTWILINNETFAFRFGYSRAEQKLWLKKHKHCSGPNQSPIAIYSRRSIPANIPAIEFIYYHNLLPTPLKINNNGYSVSLVVPRPENFTAIPYIFGGMLNGEYEFVGLHFHWGDKNNRGAEHVLNDIRYPLEMHMIHKHKKYSTVDEALDYQDGLSVLAFFYQIDESDGEDIDSIVRHLGSLDETNDIVSLTYTFSLSSLMGNINTERFYTYRGSLTTPKCNPAVTWIIFPDTISISLSQIGKFRQLSNGIEGLLLVDNFRHLQPIGNRKVFLRSVSTRFTRLDKLLTIDRHDEDSNEDENPSFWYYN